MSTTPRRIEANRRNARHSTGPRTEAGKALASRNATRHGLLSKEVVLPTEDANAFAEFAERLTAALTPEGELECVLADRVVAATWRLRRLHQVEVQIFAEESEDAFMRVANLTGSDRSLGLAFIRGGNGADAFSKLARYEANIEQGLFKALHELQRLQASRQGTPVPLPVPVDVDVSVSGGPEGRPAGGFVSQSEDFTSS